MAEKMVINEVIAQVMRDKKVTQAMMAKSIGKEKATDVSARLASKNMTFNKAIEMLSVMGYEVVVQPIPRGKRPEGQYIIIGSDK